MRWTLSLLMLCPSVCVAATLTVGAGKTFARIEEAYEAAKPGDLIEIYKPQGEAYQRTALIITKPRLTFRGMGPGVVVDGKGFDYSGVGSVPRAIFQINPEADRVSIEHLTLTGAHNQSHNGAGVRINAATGSTVSGCTIFGNDMGVMSNGAAKNPEAGYGQAITGCTIYGNGDPSDPGYSHNLYLGGAKVTVQGCHIYGSTTGHNVKSRAHYTELSYNYIHDAANREIDLVDDWDTERPDSNALLLGNVIVKEHPAGEGNRTIIHFGQDGGRKHDGTIYLVNNTIITRYIAPIVQLSHSASRARFDNNVIVNTEQASPVLVSVTSLHKPADVAGWNNWISTRYSLKSTSIDPKSRFEPKMATDAPPFVDAAKGDYRLPISWGKAYYRTPARYRNGDGKEVEAEPRSQYRAGPTMEGRLDTIQGGPIIGAAAIR
jgi:hypothetical protein